MAHCSYDSGKVLTAIGMAQVYRKSAHNGSRDSRSVCLVKFVFRRKLRIVKKTIQDSNPRSGSGVKTSGIGPKAHNSQDMNTRFGIATSPHLFLCAPLKIKLPTNPAATARPPTIATPTSPSLATLSSISVFKLCDCRLFCSKSRSNSL